MRDGVTATPCNHQGYSWEAVSDITEMRQSSAICNRLRPRVTNTKWTWMLEVSSLYECRPQRGHFDGSEWYERPCKVCTTYPDHSYGRIGTHAEFRRGEGDICKAISDTCEANETQRTLELGPVACVRLQQEVSCGTCLDVYRGHNEVAYPFGRMKV